MKDIYFFVIIILCSCNTTKILQDESFHGKEKTINRVFIDYFDSSILESNVNLADILNLSKDFEFESHKTNKSASLDKYNKTHLRYDLQYQGIKIDGCQLIVHSKENGIIELINGQYFNNFKMDCIPKIDESKARNIALKHIGAKEYSWESKRVEWYKQRNKTLSSVPNGELIIYPKRMEKDKYSLFLAYKFWVFAVQPQSENFIYVDAKNGTVINIESSEFHINGTGETKYSGTQTISTTQSGSNYILKDNTRGLGIETFDMNQGTVEALAIDFIDNDNNWSSSEHDNVEMDDAALDVHWGLEKTFDYFLQTHSRSSFDNAGEKVKGYVHDGVNWNNSSWSSYLRVLSFGDGDGILNNPSTSLDIVAHEFGHGVIRSTANFDVYGESGALMEGFSDIWGACVENYVDPNRDIWSLGNEITVSGNPIRNMADPNSISHPDTYGWNHWITGTGGNHINCTVLDYWFYLLSEGGNGVNDNSKS